MVQINLGFLRGRLCPAYTYLLVHINNTSNIFFVIKITKVSNLYEHWCIKNVAFY